METNNTSSSKTALQAPKRLLQITDTHLGAKVGEELLQLDTDESLHDVLAHMAAQEPQADLLIATGDITNDGGEPAYQRLLDIIKGHIDIDFAWLPGNHDDPAKMRAANAAAMGPVFELGNWLLILLDSSVPGEVYGELAESQLALLNKALTENPGRPSLVFLHHQPVLVGSAWIDQYIVRNADEMFSLLESFPQVKAVSWGHVHQEFYSHHKDIRLISTPSTCVQFGPKLDDFTVDRQMPAYRWYELYDDGSFETGVSRINDKSYGIDFDSDGY